MAESRSRIYSIPHITHAENSNDERAKDARYMSISYEFPVNHLFLAPFHSLHVEMHYHIPPTSADRLEGWPGVVASSRALRALRAIGLPQEPQSIIAWAAAGSGQSAHHACCSGKARRKGPGQTITRISGQAERSPAEGEARAPPARLIENDSVVTYNDKSTHYLGTTLEQRV